MASHVASREVKHRTLSHSEWEELKLLIRDLYLKKKWNYKQIAEHLSEHHAFNPTPNQFKKRVRQWRFDKYLKKTDKSKQSLPDNNASEQPQGAIDPMVLDMDSHETGSEYDSRDNARHMELVQHSASFQELLSNARNTLCGDIIISNGAGSNTGPGDLPPSAGIVGAYEDPFHGSVAPMDFEIMDGHLPESMIQSIVPSQRHTFFTTLSPFPQKNSPKANVWEPVFPSNITLSKAKTMAPQLARQFKGLGTMAPVRIIELSRDMQQVASAYYNQDLYSSAELWFRRVVTAKQKIRTHEPQETLMACIGVIDTLYYQGRCQDAGDLHRDFNIRLQKIIPSCHKIFRMSKLISCSLATQFETQDEEENELHELLQICLTTLGDQNHETLDVFLRLGFYLCGRQSYVESEKLLRAALLRIQENESSVTTGCTGGVRWVINAAVGFSRTLRRQKRYSEAELVIVKARKRYGGLLSSIDLFDLDLGIADIMFSTQRYEESEMILRRILTQQSQLIDGPPVYPHWIAYAQSLLARNLYVMGQLGEAAIWYEKCFESEIMICGLLNKSTLITCRSLGRCYAGQGFYDKVFDLAERIRLDLEKGPRRRGDSPSQSMRTIEELYRLLGDM